MKANMAVRIKVSFVPGYASQFERPSGSSHSWQRLRSEKWLTAMLTLRGWKEGKGTRPPQRVQPVCSVQLIAKEVDARSRKSEQTLKGCSLAGNFTNPCGETDVTQGSNILNNLA